MIAFCQAQHGFTTTTRDFRRIREEVQEGECGGGRATLDTTIRGLCKHVFACVLERQL